VKNHPILAGLVLPLLLSLHPRPASGAVRPHNQVKLLQAQILEREGRFNEAIKIYRDLIRAKPDNQVAYRRLAGLYRRLGRRNEESQLLETLIAIKPREIDLYRWLGDAYQATGRAEKARRLWLRIPGIFRGRFSYYGLAAKYLSKNGFYKDALSVYRRAREESGRATLFSREISRILLQLEDYKEYFRETARVLEKNPSEYIRVREQLLAACRRRQNTEEMEKSLAAAVPPGESNGYLLLLHGDLLKARGKLEAALNCYRRADSLLNRNSSLIEFGEYCLQADELRIAGEAFRSAVETAPDNVARALADYYLALTYRRLGTTDESIRLLKSIIADQAAAAIKPAAALELGRIYFTDRNSPAEALPYYEKFVQSSPPRETSQEARFELARVYAALERTADSIKLLSVLSRSRVSPGTRERAAYQVCRLNFFRKNFSSALNALESFVAEHPASDWANDALKLARTIRNGLDQDPKALGILASAGLQRYAGRDSAACDLLENGIRSCPDSPLMGEMVLSLADCYLALDRPEAACSELEKLLSDPGGGRWAGEALFKLADIYRNRLRQPDRALALLKQIVLDEPDSPLAAIAREEIKSIAGEIPSP